MRSSVFNRLLALALPLVAIHAVLTIKLFAADHAWIFYGMPVEVVIYAAAAFVLLRSSVPDATIDRRCLVLILGVAALLRLMLLFADPVSTDIYRYVWDGRVQSAGINPYLYVPADPALAGLRDTAIFPSINRADYAPTIYPPFAQIVFFLVARAGGGVLAMKATMVGFEFLAIVAILNLLRRRGLPATRILLYVWHPLPIWEFAGSGHVDALALACVTLALLAAEMRRPLLAGMALGGATLVKFFPVVIGPALWRRWDWRLPVAGFSTLLVLYAPYLGAGRKIFGFLPAYAGEVGFEDGSGFYPWMLIRRLVPVIPPDAVAVYLPGLALLLAALGLVVLLRPRDHVVDITGAFVLAAAFTVMTTPHYPWYLAWLVPFLCFVPSAAVVYLTGSNTLLYLAGWPLSFGWLSAIYLPFFALLVQEGIARFIRSKEKRHGHAVTAGAG